MRELRPVQDAEQGGGGQHAGGVSQVCRDLPQQNQKARQLHVSRGGWVEDPSIRQHNQDNDVSHSGVTLTTNNPKVIHLYMDIIVL